MMYSPDAGDDACEAKANIDKQQTSKRRCIMNNERTIYAAREIAQVVWRDRRARLPSRMAFRTAESLPFRLDFFPHQVFPFLPFSNQREFVAAHQRLCRQRTRIVVGRHHKSVSARAHDRQQIALVKLWHFPIQRKEITRFTYRPNNVDLLRLTLTLTLAHARARDRLSHRHDFVIALIERRSDQVVHASIDDGEFLRARFFDVPDARQQYAGVADEKTTRLDEDSNIQLAQRRHNCVSVIADAERGRFAAMIMPPFA